MLRTNIFALCALFLTSQISYAQLDTDNNYTGLWSNNTSWANGVTATVPTYSSGKVDNQDNFDIYGYITSTSSLIFKNIGNNNFELTIYDTLVVEGDLTFENNSISLTVPANGLLVVLGNFSTNNKVTIDNGGTIAVTGDLTISGGQADYSDGGGGLYVDGTVSGDADATSAQEAVLSLDGTGNSGEQDLHDFITDGGTTSTLPIELVSFTAANSNDKVRLMWATAQETDNDYFLLERSYDGKEFMIVSTVIGAGNSDKQLEYSIEDQPLAFGQVYYRLTQYDFDGKFEQFPVIAVVYQPQLGFRTNIYPSRVNVGAHVYSHNSWGEIYNVEMSLTSLNGHGHMELPYQKIDNKLGFKMPSVTPGVYLMKGSINGVEVSQRIVLTQ